MWGGIRISDSYSRDKGLHLVYFTLSYLDVKWFIVKLEVQLWKWLGTTFLQFLCSINQYPNVFLRAIRLQMFKSWINKPLPKGIPPSITCHWQSSIIHLCSPVHEIPPHIFPISPLPSTPLLLFLFLGSSALLEFLFPPLWYILDPLDSLLIVFVILMNWNEYPVICNLLESPKQPSSTVVYPLSCVFVSKQHILRNFWKSLKLKKWKDGWDKSNPTFCTSKPLSMSISLFV